MTGRQSYTGRSTKQWEFLRMTIISGLKRSNKNKCWLVWIASDRIWHFISNLSARELKSTYHLSDNGDQMRKCWPCALAVLGLKSLQKPALAHLGLERPSLFTHRRSRATGQLNSVMHLPYPSLRTSAGAKPQDTVYVGKPWKDQVIELK